MKKIGIITLSGFSNYGNVLQNYALQEFLNGRGFSAETIWFENEGKGSFDKVLLHLKRGDLGKSLVLKWKKSKDSTGAKQQLANSRQNYIKNFCMEHILYSEYRLNGKPTKTEKKEINAFFDFLLVGSDQVWGLRGKELSAVFFLNFVKKEKRNSFAASFGFSKIPYKSKRTRYNRLLRQMNNISVREIEGVDIVKNVSSKDATLLLDPTMLLSSDRWGKIATSFRTVMNTKKYVVVYTIGELSRQALKVVRDISTDRSLDVVVLNNPEYPEYFAISPGEFLDIIRNAECIVTDSFHGAVFSTIFRRPFLVVERVDNMVNMNSRLTTLLKTLGLERHMYRGKSVGYTDFKFTSSELSNVEKQLNINYTKSCQYIEQIEKSLED